MYKKLSGILIIAIFLIISIGVISAAEDSISVEVIWEDNANDRPTEITVNLIKDGKVVETAELNESNSWKTTFKVDDDGDYKVIESEISGYDTEISGDANRGFIIKNSLIKSDVLGASGVETPEDDILADGSNTSNNLISANNESVASNSSNSVNNISTTSNSNDTNNSTNSTNDNANSTVDDNSDGDEVSTTTTKTTTVKKIIKHDKKKPVNDTKSADKKTGFPLAVLVVAVFAAAFVPLTRKK